MDECPQRPPEVITQSLIRKMAERIDRLEKVHEEDQTKLVALQAELCDVRGKLGTLEKARDEDQVKLAAVERAHCEDKKKLKPQIKDLQKGNTLVVGKRRN